MSESRRQYTREFKIEAVRMLNNGKSGRDIEGELGIGKGVVYRWRRQLEEEGDGIRAFPGIGNARDEELACLRKELREVKEERDILRKAAAIFSRVKR